MKLCILQVVNESVAKLVHFLYHHLMIHNGLHEGYENEA